MLAGTVFAASDRAIVTIILLMAPEETKVALSGCFCYFVQKKDQKCLPSHLENGEHAPRRDVVAVDETEGIRDGIPQA